MRKLIDTTILLILLLAPAVLLVSVDKFMDKEENTPTNHATETHSFIDSTDNLAVAKIEELQVANQHPRP